MVKTMYSLESRLLEASQFWLMSRIKVYHTRMWVPEVEELLQSEKLMSSVQNIGDIITIDIWESRGRRKNDIKKDLK